MFSFLSHIKPIVASFLLVLSMLVILPRDLWHHCDHHIHSDAQQHDSGDAHQQVNDEHHCLICDFQIQPYIQETPSYNSET